MITLVSDTHGTNGHRLTGRTLDAVREADLVVHAGDFTTEVVYEAFRREAAELVAVTGNRDRRAVREHLSGTATAEADGLRVVVAHGHEHDRTALSLLARQEDADLVVVGHSHQPGVEKLGDATLVNPGSHADPRRYTAAHGELEPAGKGWTGRLVTPDGEVLREFALPQA
ncbi:metallophosphoesterase [Haloarculaceae archaeon H-GB2-1]|nr:metallophosphoesterase [Haloarculaceae archaeon H-GB1-1]MEA5406757.1 metallophosphoesterase [Haloarculaceae archaeon H-GB2-1]